MSVDFHSINSVETCGICFETMDNSVAWAHDGAHGEKHPWHPECIKSWMKIDNHCPCCQITMNRSFAFSWGERVIIQLEQAKNDGWIGVGATLGALVGIQATNIGAGLTVDGLAVVAGAIVGAAGGVIMSAIKGFH